MISMFVEFPQRSWLAGKVIQVYLTSRHYPGISIYKSVSIIVEEQDGHKRAIKLYVEQKLDGGAEPQMDRLRQRVYDRSDHIYLWVTLMLWISHNLLLHPHQPTCRLPRLPEV